VGGDEGLLVAAADDPGGTVAGVRLTLLNAFALECDGVAVQLPASAQRVLAFVALHEHPVRRPYVAGSLWLDSPEERAYANLRSALWRLRRFGSRLVDAEGSELALGRDVEVDLRDCEQLARRAVAREQRDLDALDVRLFGSDLLPDWYEDWVLIEREHYRQLRLHALDALCEQLTASGRLDEALEAGLAAVAGEPLRESAQRALIRVHLAEGNGGEAIRQYRLYRHLLDEQLGIEPSPLMAELVRDLDAVETIR
jgi:DNA-binding SARP family transcriptional activator